MREMIEVGSEWRSVDSGLVATGERVKVAEVDRYSCLVKAIDGELKGERWNLDRAWFLNKFSPVDEATPSIEVGSEWVCKTSGRRAKVLSVLSGRVTYQCNDDAVRPSPWLFTASFLERFAPAPPAAEVAADDAPPPVKLGSEWQSVKAPEHQVTVVGFRRRGDGGWDDEFRHKVGPIHCLSSAQSRRDFVPADAPPATPPYGPVKTFASGAVRSMDGESVRYDLVSPIGLRRLAETYAEGAEKYTVGNWLKGIPASNLLSRLMRHVDLYRAGDRDEDHLAHAAWGLFALMHFEETRPDLMDLVDFAGIGGGK